jgi:hydroxypyruvate isomerase
MPRFAANISTLYGEFEFLDRLGAARADGFLAIEAQGIGHIALSELHRRTLDHGLQWALFNAPAGDAAKGDRGLAAQPGREEEFKRAIDEAVEAVQVLSCPCVHVLSGVIPGDDSASVRQRMRQTLLENMRWASESAREIPVTWLLEPINPRDMPGYFLNTQAQAHAVCDELALPNVKVQMDFYHCQIVEGDLARKWQRYHPGVGHIQIAGVPDRHEPDSGEVNYPYLFELIDGADYAGWIGCEYRPRTTTREGLSWLRPWL